MTEMEDGKINRIDDVWVVEKYYREYIDLVYDSNRVKERFDEKDFKVIEQKEYIMNDLLLEDEFREKYVDMPQKSCIPGYRFMTRLTLREID